MQNISLDKKLKELFSILKSLLDGEQQNDNFIKEIEDSEIKIYAVFLKDNATFFNNEDELNAYLFEKNIIENDSSVCSIEYKRHFGGKNDVVVISNMEDGSRPKYCTSSYMEGFLSYNEVESIYKSEFVWDYNYGTYLVPIYEELGRCGIIFENDSYVKYNNGNRVLSKTLNRNY